MASDNRGEFIIFAFGLHVDMNTIKFGTDGWRAVIAKDFTVRNLARVSAAISTWLFKKYKEPSVVVGYDCRFGGKMFSETVAKVLAFKGIKVLLAPDFVTTPMVSLGVLRLDATLGIMITASHNPPEYNGLKLKGPHGGPLFESDVKNVEALIPEDNVINLETIRWEELLDQRGVEYADLESLYIEEVKKHFDIRKIVGSGLKLAFDAMHGSGQNIMPRILPGIKCLNCDVDPFFKGIPPEPLEHNLMSFSEKIRGKWKVDAGIAVDGDADRIAMMDADGRYVDSHHIMLLLIHYLAGYKKRKGKVVTGFSSTVKVEKLARHYKLPAQRVKIGFKEISEVMVEDNVLVGGEESGGISIAGTLPERDGIWMGLTLLEFMAETKKSLRTLIEEVYDIVGAFAYQRQDLKIEKDLKSRVLKNCQENVYKNFGSFKVTRVETIDGWKFFFNTSEWYMIRPSGTEPVLRTYAEAKTEQRVSEIMRAGYEAIMKS